MLNKADMEKMKFYSTDSTDYGDPRYSAYFRETAPANDPGLAQAAAKVGV